MPRVLPIHSAELATVSRKEKQWEILPTVGGKLWAGSLSHVLSSVSAESGGPCGRLGCGRSQAIDGFLFGHAGVAPYPVPGHLVPDAGAPQLLPEGLILNRRAVARAPVSRSPQRQQFRHARDQIA